VDDELPPVITDKYLVSQVNVLYIFKQWGWAAFVNQFEDFLRDLHIEVGVLPFLISHATKNVTAVFCVKFSMYMAYSRWSILGPGRA